MSATCGDYALPENYIWSVGDAVMQIGVFVILALIIVGLAVFKYLLDVDKDRVQAVFGFFMKQPSVPLTIYLGFNRLDPKGIRQPALDFLEEDGDELPEEEGILTAQFLLYEYFNELLRAKYDGATTDWNSFKLWVQFESQQGRQVSGAPEELDRLVQFLTNQNPTMRVP
jgi:hypothetical protein